MLAMAMVVRDGLGTLAVVAVLVLLVNKSERTGPR
jgi:hypothetical protein